MDPPGMNRTSSNGPPWRDNDGTKEDTSLERDAAGSRWRNRRRAEDPTAESDEFRMHVFKINHCTKRGPHDWTACPYAHPGEKANRRDPSLYAAVLCPDARNQQSECPRGASCHMAHSVFEFYLHPMRYRTTLCKDGPHCTRPVCFFAHSQDQLRQPTPATHNMAGSSSSGTPPAGPTDQPRAQHNLPELQALSQGPSGGYAGTPAADLADLLGYASSSGPLLQQQQRQQELLLCATNGSSGDGIGRSTDLLLMPVSPVQDGLLQCPTPGSWPLVSPGPAAWPAGSLCSPLFAGPGLASPQCTLTALLDKQHQHEQATAALSSQADALGAQLQALAARADGAGSASAAAAGGLFAQRSGAAAGAASARVAGGMMPRWDLQAIVPSSLLLPSAQGVLCPGHVSAPAGAAAMRGMRSASFQEQHLLADLQQLQLQQGPGAAGAMGPAAAALSAPLRQVWSQPQLSGTPQDWSQDLSGLLLTSGVMQPAWPSPDATAASNMMLSSSSSSHGQLLLPNASAGQPSSRSTGWW